MTIIISPLLKRRAGPGCAALQLTWGRAQVVVVMTVKKRSRVDSEGPPTPPPGQVRPGSPIARPMQFVPAIPLVVLGACSLAVAGGLLRGDAGPWIKTSLQHGAGTRSTTPSEKTMCSPKVLPSRLLDPMHRGTEEKGLNAMCGGLLAGHVCAQSETPVQDGAGVTYMTPMEKTMSSSGARPSSLSDAMLGAAADNSLRSVRTSTSSSDERSLLQQQGAAAVVSSVHDSLAKHNGAATALDYLESMSIRWLQTAHEQRGTNVTHSSIGQARIAGQTQSSQRRMREKGMTTLRSDNHFIAGACYIWPQPCVRSDT